MKNRILLNVYAIYCIRKLKNPFIAESFILIILSTILLYFVSVPSVLMNMQTSESAYRYFLTAISEADPFVKIILVSVGITGFFFIRDNTIYSGLKQRFA